MAHVSLSIHGANRIECRALSGYERLGEPSRFELERFAPEPVDPDDLIGQACQIVLGTDGGEHVVAGVIARFAALATSQATSGRR